MEIGLDAWWKTCREETEFTSDDVWARLPAQPKDGRAMGAVARVALNSGWCIATGAYQQTGRARAHARPIRVYRSLVRR